MCYLVQQRQAEASKGGADPLAAPDSARPRWIGVVGIALVGGLALAAYVAPQPPAPASQATESATMAPLALKATATGQPSIAGQRSTMMDDGVPSAADDKQAAKGNCHHGL